MANLPSVVSPVNPHFFQPLLPGFLTQINIPVAFFSKYIEGRNEQKKAKLRSDDSCKTWVVKMDGRRFTNGWEDFAVAHDLRIGDFVVFRHEGELVFHVTACGPSCCEIQYTSSQNINDDHHRKLIQIRPTKKNPRRKQESSSDHSCFVANVSVSSLCDDKLYIPVKFARSNSLSNRYCKVLLLNEKGRSWKLKLDHDKSGIHTYLRDGWRSFCSANGINRGRYVFKMIRNSGTPVIRLCQGQADYRLDSETPSYDSCFVGSVPPSSLRIDALYLPKGFVRSNGLDEGCGEMVLMNENGGTWNLVLKHYKSKNTTVITRGWKSFCQVNGIKARDPFTFKLVGSREKPVLRLCPAESNRATRLVEGSDVHSLSTDLISGEESSETEESEEKSIEDKGKGVIIVKEEKIQDKGSLRECLNIEKLKYSSRLGASSQNRFVKLTITPYCFRSNKLRLPLRFTRVNGIKKQGKIALLGEDGIKWMVHIVKDNRRGTMRLGRDWKGFCEVHGVKIGDSFVLQLIREEDASPVFKFITKASCV